MRAVILNGYGDQSVLELKERESPSPKDYEVLIKVAAAGVNRPDIFQRQGKYPAPEGVVQDILGLEVSGVITGVGKKVTQFQAGEQVCALVPGGGYAEFVTADEGSCLPVPSGFSLQDAAALPEALFTVWHNLFQRAGLQVGEKVLIYGGSGGIGTMAIQLVRLWGAEACTLASSDAKMAFCSELGAKKVASYPKDNLVDFFGKSSFDVILDSLGGDFFDLNLNLLKPEGRLVYINAMEGVKPHLNILKMMQKRLWITGSTLRSRKLDFKASLAGEIVQKAYPLIETETFINPVRHRIPVEKVSEAHSLMESRDFYGKIILLF